MRRAAVPLLLASFVFLRGMWCLLWIPPWQGPDEPMHFVLAISSVVSMNEADRVEMEQAVIKSMASHRFWPLTGQVEPDPLPILLRTSRHIPAPTLYHRVLGVWLLAGGLSPRGDSWLEPASLGHWVRVGRALSVVFLAVATWAIHATGLTLAEPWFALTWALLFAAQPQMAFIGSCLNSDNMVVCLAAVGLLLVARCLVKPSRWVTGAALACCVLAPLAKRPGLAVTLTTLPVVLTTLPRRRVLLPLGVAALAMAAAGLSILGMSTSTINDLREALGLGGWVGTLPPGWWATFTTHFWETFWGSFGWVQCPLNQTVLRILAVVTASTLVTAPRACSGMPRPGPLRRTALVATAQVVLALLQVLLGQGLRGELAQGRHAFVALPGLLLLMALGLRGIVPARARWLVPTAGVVAVLLCEVALWYVCLPCFLR